MDKKKVRKWLIEILIIILILSGVRLWTHRDIISGVAPDLQATMLNGKNFDLSKIKKPVLVHFWATWCPVCKLEQSNIQNISRDATVITIVMQSGSDEDLGQYLKDEKLTFKVINDEIGELAKKFRVKGVPVSFVVNNKNEIAFAETGYTTELGLRARLWWAGL